VGKIAKKNSLEGVRFY